MLDLFTPVAEDEKLNRFFKLLLKDENEPERKVLNSWAEGFEDRDGKFVYEFQTTFESSMWELYLNAFLKELGAQTDFSHNAPDFVTKLDMDVVIEATIAAPPKGGAVPTGSSQISAPDNFAEFNKQSAIRISNSMSSKIKKYRNSYANLSHVKEKPYVIAIASFDQPYAHYAVNRSIVAVLYGLYTDEETTLAVGAEEMIEYPIEAIIKNENATIPVGLFATDEYKEVSAVIYSSLATWGKIRALADKPDALSIYATIHSHNNGGIIPETRNQLKAEYIESIADGLHILHNPFAEIPLDAKTFDHERVAQYFVDEKGSINIEAPEDFLLLRQIISLTAR